MWWDERVVVRDARHDKVANLVSAIPACDSRTTPTTSRKENGHLVSTAIVHMWLDSAALAQARETIERTVAETRQFTGCHGVTCLEDATDETHLILVEEWESLAHDQAYRAWRAGDGAVAGMGSLLARNPHVTRCTALGAKPEDE